MQNRKFQNRKESLLHLWEQAVHAHQHWKESPSAQCAWTLVKIFFSLAFHLLRLYIAPR